MDKFLLASDKFLLDKCFLPLENAHKQGHSHIMLRILRQYKIGMIAMIFTDR